MATNSTKTRFLLAAFCLLAAILSAMPARGAIAYTSGLVEKDTFVTSAIHTGEFGFEGHLSLGGQYGIFLCFNLTSRPEKWDSASLVLWPRETIIPMQACLYTTNTSWNESMISWNNRPSLLDYAENFTLTRSGNTVNISLTTLLHQFDNSPPTTQVSILINYTGADRNTFGSRHDLITKYAPHIQWETQVPDDWVLVALLAGGISFAAMAAITYAVMKRKKAKKPPTPPTGSGAAPTGELDFDV